MTQQNDAVTTQLAKLQDVLLEGRISQEIYESAEGGFVECRRSKAEGVYARGNEL